MTEYQEGDTIDPYRGSVEGETGVCVSHEPESYVRDKKWDHKPSRRWCPCEHISTGLHVGLENDFSEYTAEVMLYCEECQEEFTAVLAVN